MKEPKLEAEHYREDDGKIITEIIIIFLGVLLTISIIGVIALCLKKYL